MLGGEKGSVAFHGDHRPAKVATHRQSRNLLDPSLRLVTTSNIRYNYPRNQEEFERGGFSLMAGVTYTLQVDVGGSNAPSGIYFNKNIGPYSGNNLAYAYGKTVLTYTPEVDIRSANVDVYWSSGKEPSDMSGIVVWVVEGTEALPYEPYGTIEQVISEPVESTREGTMITFDRTYNDRAEVSVFGESVQETLTGKNLINRPREYTLTGAAMIQKVDLAAGSYYFSSESVTGEDINPRCMIYTNGAQTVLADFVLTKNARTEKLINISDDYAEAEVWLYANGGLITSQGKTATYNSIQLEKGTTATSYEPYCGGIPAPNPSYHMPIESRAAACVETSNADGSKTSTTDLTALLDGRELRSLPDGTRDELQVRDNGDGTGDVVLVENVLHAVLAVADMNNNESFPGWVNVDGLYEACPNINEKVACINSAGFFYGGKELIGVNTRTTNVSALWSTQSAIGMTQSEFKEAYPNLVIDFCIKRNVTKEILLGTIPIPETFYDTTHVWEANGADISARVKVFG